MAVWHLRVLAFVVKANECNGIKLKFAEYQTYLVGLVFVYKKESCTSVI